MQITIDVNEVYTTIAKTKPDMEVGSRGEVLAKIDDMKEYTAKILELAGEGNDIVLTGGAPIWLYLCVGHALHGKAMSLSYVAPNTANKIVNVFNHNPY